MIKAMNKLEEKKAKDNVDAKKKLDESIKKLKK